MPSLALVLSLGCVDPGAVEAPAYPSLARVSLADAGDYDLVITEFFPDPVATSDADGEWFEIVNLRDESISLFGLAVADLDGERFEVTDPDAEIAPGQHLVFGNNADPATNGGVTVDIAYAGADLVIANTADELILYDGARALDHVFYVFPPLPSGPGTSTSLRPELTGDRSTHSAGRWCTATTPFGLGDLGTPGAPNDCAPEGDGDGAWPPEDCDDTDPTVGPRAWDLLGDGIDQDCDGVDGGVPLSVYELTHGDLVITEVMVNPARVADSVGEWFEVRNDAGRPVDLFGLEVSDSGIDSFLVLEWLLVNPGERVVFGRTFDTLANGGVAVDFAYTKEMALANYEDEVFLSAGASV
jgi:hypothetical protein